MFAYQVHFSHPWSTSAKGL